MSLTVLLPPTNRASKESIAEKKIALITIDDMITTMKSLGEKPEDV